MNKKLLKCVSLLLAIFAVINILTPVAKATETDTDVAAVISQLEAIDTLQQMQDKRGTYKVSTAHYDTGTTNQAVIDEHIAAREGYETYVAEMFAMRAAAQAAYDALNDAQKALIDEALVAKLSNELPNTVYIDTFSVTPADDEYTFEAVNGTQDIDRKAGYGYEVSNYMVSGQIPQTFILVDTSDGKTSWTPSGLYIPEESNFDVAYCCDVMTELHYNTDYKRLNLEDSGYYGPDAAEHIRAILLNSYPFVTMDEMKAFLIENGLNEEFVNNLSRSDMISAVQMAVWTYANAADGAQDGLNYFATINIPKNIGIYFSPLHDHTNETWDWQPGKRQRSFDENAEYRVNNLAYFLCHLDGISADDDQIVISDIKVTRAELIPDSESMYDVGMYVYLNNAGKKEDNLIVKVTSYDENGNVTDQSAQSVWGNSKLAMFVKAKENDTIKVEVDGTQTLAKGVYFYEPEGGRDVSQCLVGVSGGKTKVHAEEEFVFEKQIENMGLNIYKTDSKTGFPVSEITFTIYNTGLDADAELPEIKDDIIAGYKADTLADFPVTTDATGYAGATLAKGVYLVVEEPNSKVKTPVDPFYITIPLDVEVKNDDGSVTVKTLDIVSVYPKNELNPPKETPPVFPPVPGDITNTFEIIKYDAKDREKLLSGAVFEVFRPVTSADETENTIILDVDGISYQVLPVLVNGEPLVLTTDENGHAKPSEELPCGTYFLLETKAPEGYNLLSKPVTVEVTSKLVTPDPIVVEIPNQSGTLLPTTGGMGTKLFLTGGCIIAVMAGILLVTRRRAAVR